MWRRVALIRTDISGELSATIIRVARIGELGTLAATSKRRTLLSNTNVPHLPILVTLVMQALRSSETSVFTRITPSNIPEDGILHTAVKTTNLTYHYPTELYS
jgi:hypothetical protein